MSSCTRANSAKLLPFVDRLDECRLICHPDAEKLRSGGLRGDPKTCCVVVSKQPGAGKTSLGMECLRVARDNPPDGYTPEEWRARLPICTVHCEAGRSDSLADVLTSVAHEAIKRAGQLKADTSRVDGGEFYGVVKVRPYQPCGTEEPFKKVDIGALVGHLWEDRESLGLSPETDDQFETIRVRLEDELEGQPLINWRQIVRGIVERPSDANKVCAWLYMKVAVDRVGQACADWNELFGFGTEDRPAALLIVIDEAQWVLPGKEVDDVFGKLEQDRIAIEQIEKKQRYADVAHGLEVELMENELQRLIRHRDKQEAKLKDIRKEVKNVFETMQPVFRRSRFLWTGVSSAAVDLQMSRGDGGTGFRIVSVTLPPLDMMQWTDALESGHSDEADNLLREMIQKLQKEEAVQVAWADIKDDPEELKRRALAGMMSSTGGWPKEVHSFLGILNEEEMNWIDTVFGSDERKERMRESTRQLLDRAYLEPDTSVLDLLEAMGCLTKLEQGRIFYELFHTSGMRLVGIDKKTPVIYVPDGDSINGVATVGSLAQTWVRHTTGSLLLLSRLRMQTETVYAQRGAWEAFTQDPAEEATVNMLSHLDSFCGSRLKDVFPWLNGTDADFADKSLESTGLRAFRGLAVNSSGKLANAPDRVEDHKHVTEQIKPVKLKDWLKARCVDSKDFVPFLYIFKPRSASGDILLVLKDLHVHIQVKNAAREDWTGERDKMAAVSCDEVTNIILFVNYYDKIKGAPRSFVEMSTQPRATIRGVFKMAGQKEVDESTEFSEECLVADLQKLWQKRFAKSIEEEMNVFDTMEPTPEAVAAAESEALEDRPKKKPRNKSTRRRKSTPGRRPTPR